MERLSPDNHISDSRVSRGGSQSWSSVHHHRVVWTTGLLNLSPINVNLPCFGKGHILVQTPNLHGSFMVHFFKIQNRQRKWKQVIWRAAFLLWHLATQNHICANSLCTYVEILGIREFLYLPCRPYPSGKNNLGRVILRWKNNGGKIVNFPRKVQVWGKKITASFHLSFHWEAECHRLLWV